MAVSLSGAGASGVGTAAIQLIQLAGARAIVTVGSAEKQAEVGDALMIYMPAEQEQTTALGAIAAVNYKNGPWLGEVLAATAGHGVDVVLDCIGEQYWEQNADVLKTDGRWILYGTMGGGNVNGPLLRKLLHKRIALLPTTLRTRSDEYKAELVSRFHAATWEGFAAGKLKCGACRRLARC